MTEATDEQKQFVLDQHEMYGALAMRVAAIRRALDGGADLADVLVRETRDILASGMTREQLASALVSVMARVAQGEDLGVDGGIFAAVTAGLVELPPIPRGGIRFPLPGEQA